MCKDSILKEQSIIKANELFSHGNIPKTCSNMTEEQKYFFAKYGAVKILHLFNNLKTIYAAEDSIAFKNAIEVYKRTDVDFAYKAEIIRNRREEALVKLVNEHYDQNQNAKIILIYGGNHKFSQYVPYDEKHYEEIVTHK